MGTPPKEGNTYDFPSSGGVPERRGGFSGLEYNSNQTKKL